MRLFFKYVFIFLGIAITLILFWASLDKMIHLIKMQLGNPVSASSIEKHYENHLLLGYVHIVLGMLFLLLGGHQLIPYFRKRNYVLHRRIGKLFLSICLIVFTTAIVLGLYYPFGNYLESITTFVFGSFLLFATYKAYATARQKKFSLHENWVIRIYFIALSVSTIRGIATLFIVSKNGSLQSIFGISFLVGFLLHLFFVELYIRLLSKPRV